MKTVVTHMAPDMDAGTSTWLIRKYLPDWHDAQLKFVPAGKTLDEKPPDDNSDIIHVDTGLGKFDHHQFKEKLSASKLVFDFLKEKKYIPQFDIAGLERLIAFITVIDNFGEVYFPDPTADVYDFTLYQFTEGLRPTLSSDEKMIEFISTALEGVLQVLKNKVRAEEEIQKGVLFQTSWGKSLVMETKNEEAMKLALKLGHVVVARRDPAKGTIRIKTLPETGKYDLTPVYEKVKQMDPKASWFLHSSKHMLLNGSSKNPTAIPSQITLSQLIEIIKAI